MCLLCRDRCLPSSVSSWRFSGTLTIAYHWRCSCCWRPVYTSALTSDLCIAFKYLFWIWYTLDAEYLNKETPSLFLQFLWRISNLLPRMNSKLTFTKLKALCQVFCISTNCCVDHKPYMCRVDFRVFYHSELKEADVRLYFSLFSVT